MSNIIELEFTMKLPDIHLEKLTTEKNKTQKWWYKGDHICYAVVNRDTDKVVSCINTDMLNSGRPIPPNYTYIEVNAEVETLIAYLLSPPGFDESEKNELYEKGFQVFEEAIGIYPEYSIPTPIIPNHVYEEQVYYDPSIKRLYAKFASVDEDFTWDAVKYHRNQLLRQSDGEVSEDMPEDVKNKITTYRQALRDLPDRLGHLSAYRASQMMPKHPGL